MWSKVARSKAISAVKSHSVMCWHGNKYAAFARAFQVGAGASMAVLFLARAVEVTATAWLAASTVEVYLSPCTRCGTVHVLVR